MWTVVELLPLYRWSSIEWNSMEWPAGCFHRCSWCNHGRNITDRRWPRENKRYNWDIRLDWGCRESSVSLDQHSTANFSSRCSVWHFVSNDNHRRKQSQAQSTSACWPSEAHWCPTCNCRSRRSVDECELKWFECASPMELIEGTYPHSGRAYRKRRPPSVRMRKGPSKASDRPPMIERRDARFLSRNKNNWERYRAHWLKQRQIVSTVLFTDVTKRCQKWTSIIPTMCRDNVFFALGGKKRRKAMPKINAKISEKRKLNWSIGSPAMLAMGLNMYEPL